MIAFAQDGPLNNKEVTSSTAVTDPLNAAATAVPPDDWTPPTEEDMKEAKRLHAQVEEDIAKGQLKVPASSQTPEEFRTTICAGIVARWFMAVRHHFPRYWQTLSSLESIFVDYRKNPDSDKEDLLKDSVRVISGKDTLNIDELSSVLKDLGTVFDRHGHQRVASVFFHAASHLT